MGPDTTLPLHVWGPPEAPVLVCLHGFLGTGADWADLAARLPNRRVLAPDLPGHGAAVEQPDRAYIFEGAVEAILATLDAAGVEQFALLGYSMGGRLALALALAAPTRVSALLLESASPGLRTEAERHERRRLDAERAEALRADLPRFLHDWYRLPLFATLSPAQRSRLEAERARGDAAALAHALEGLGAGAQPDLWPELPHLAMPTTAIAGVLDAKFVAIARTMQASHPPMRVEVVPGAGHNVHVEAPEAFADIVQAVTG